MQIANCRGARIAYQIDGNSSAPCILLSNSLGTDMSMWDPQISALGKHYRVLRYDMRGHGASSVPEGPYTIEELGNDVLDLLDSLDIGQVHFCGLSIGGIIGQWLAVHSPERLQRVILSNTAAKIGNSETWNDRISRVRRGGMAAIADAVISRWFSRSFLERQPDEPARLRSILLAMKQEGYTSACAALRDNDMRDFARAIRTPTLLIAGQFDTVTTIGHAEELHRAIRSSTLRSIPGSHISNIEARSAFNAAVLRFLQKEDQQ